MLSGLSYPPCPTSIIVCKVPSAALLITPTKVWKTVALKALKDLESMILGPNPGNELATATDVRTSSFCGFDGVHAGYRDELRRTDVQHEPSSISLLYRRVDSKPRQGRYMWVLEKGLTNTVFAFNHSSEEVFTFWIQASISDTNTQVYAQSNFCRWVPVANLAAREDCEVLIPQSSAFDGQVQAWNGCGNTCFMSHERAWLVFQ